MKYIPIINIFAIEIFFSLSRVFNYQYGGKETSPVYLIYNIILFVLSAATFIFYSLIKRCKYERRHMCIFSIPFALTFLYLTSVLLGRADSMSTEKFIFFFLWSVPAIYAGIYISEGDRFNYLGSLLELVMIIFTVAIFLTTLEVFADGSTATIGGASYQIASYISAFAYGINLYYLFYGNNHKRFRFANTRTYKLISIVMLLVQVIGVFTSGGRGGMVLVLIYTIYLCGSFLRRHNLRQVIKYVLTLLLVITVLAFLMPKLFQFDVFKFSFNRIFAYISADGINWEGTSGRLKVYQGAQELIVRSPLIGYGIFGTWKVYGSYPHNIFLELLLHGGIIYFCFGVIFLAFTSRRYLRLVKAEPKLRIIGIIALYPLTMLQFSGTYLNEPIFWFAIAALFACDTEKVIRSKDKLIAEGFI